MLRSADKQVSQSYSENVKGANRTRAIITTVVIALLIIAAFSVVYVSRADVTAKQGSPITVSTNQTQTQTTYTADYSFFIQPNIAHLNALREWFMTPLDLANDKAGYDASYGMIRGGYWNGGFQNGFVLIDSQLIVAKTLDFLNAQQGVKTDIEGNLSHWLSNTTFVDPATGQASTYSGNDRREIMFGNLEQCVMDDSGQVYYAPGHTLSDPVPITTAIPTKCAGSGAQSMNTFALQIELSFLQGNTNAAEQMFQNTLSGWTPTSGTGLGGTIGGYFSNTFDGGSCKNSRTLGYWIEMARATGFWSLNSQSKTVAQEVMNELWAHQLPSGGISVNYPGCGNNNKDSAESTGLALVAFDPRVPMWFNHAGAADNSTSSGFISLPISNGMPFTLPLAKDSTSITQR